MSKIYVNFKKIRDANYDLPYLEVKAAYVKKHIDKMKRELSGEIFNNVQIRQRLEKISQKTGELGEQIDELFTVTNSCVEQYEATEYEISMNAKAFY